MDYGRESDITKAVTIAEDMVSISTVEQLHTAAETPVRDTLRVAAKNVYSSYREARCPAQQSVSLHTDDMWSSRTCEPYMEDWTETCLSPDHSGQHTAEALQDALTTWLKRG